MGRGGAEENDVSRQDREGRKGRPGAPRVRRAEPIRPRDLPWARTQRAFRWKSCGRDAARGIPGRPESDLGEPLWAL